MTRSATHRTLAAAAQQPVAPASAIMPVGQQNELVKTRCMICHTDANRKGGLSLQGFDAARPDPGLARMMAVKVADDGAMMAAGAPVPDHETIDAFVGALSAVTRRSSPAPNGWTVDLTVDPLTPSRGHSFVTVRAVQELALPGDTRASAVYQLTLSCNGAIRRANTQLSTYTKAGPNAPMVARTFPAAPTLAPLLSAESLAVNELFPGEHVVFPIDTLNPTLRELFSWCYAAPGTRDSAR